MDALLRFRREAEKLCVVLEEAPELDPSAFTRRARNGVAGAYLAAALLPRAVFEDDDVGPPEGRTGRFEALESTIRALLATDDIFFDVWDPTQPEAGITRSLSQELIEIYEDLNEALTRLPESGEPEAAVLWEIEWAFENHWGKHAVDVLRPLHHLALR